MAHTRIALIVVVLTAVVTLAACATTNRIPEGTAFNDYWVGKNEGAFIQVWGAPARQVTDGKGGHILVVERKSIQFRFCLGGCPSWTPDRLTMASYIVYVGPDGIIYKADITHEAINP